GITALTVLRVPLRTSVLTAVVRAIIQLATIGAVIHFVFRHPAAAAGLLAVMFVVAVATAARRLRDLGRTLPAVALAILVGVTPVTLPGPSVASLAGAPSAAGAARFQLIVLVGIIVAQVLASGTLLTLLGAPTTLPADPELPSTRHRTND